MGICFPHGSELFSNLALDSGWVLFVTMKPNGSFSFQALYNLKSPHVDKIEKPETLKKCQSRDIVCVENKPPAWYVQ